MSEVIYKPFQLFIGVPASVFLIPCLLFGLFLYSRAQNRKGKHLSYRPLLFPICVWTLYAIYEVSIASKGYNIRVDLFIIAPFLYVSLIAGLAPWLFGWIRSRIPALARGDQEILRRSKGVTILGWFTAVFGGIWFLSGFMSLEIAQRVAMDMHTPLWKSRMFLESLVGFILSIGYLAGSMGILQLRRWARIGILWVASLDLGWDLLRIGFLRRTALTLLSVGVVLPVVLLWFLTRPSVKGQFRKGV